MLSHAQVLKDVLFRTIVCPKNDIREKASCGVFNEMRGSVVKVTEGYERYKEDERAIECAGCR